MAASTENAMRRVRMAERCGQFGSYPDAVASGALVFTSGARAGAPGAGLAALAVEARQLEALMTRPQVLLLDEPTAALSPVRATEVLHNLEHVSRFENIGLVLIEQHVLPALDVAERRLSCVVDACVRRQYGETGAQTEPLGAVLKLAGGCSI
jgi:hypothetical protein